MNITHTRYSQYTAVVLTGLLFTLRVLRLGHKFGLRLSLRHYDVIFSCKLIRLVF